MLGTLTPQPLSMTVDELISLSEYAAYSERLFPGLVAATLQQAPTPPSVSELESLEDVMVALRRYRLAQSVRLLWLDVTGQCSLEEIGHRLSSLARDCLTQALHSAEMEVERQQGQLLDQTGRPMHLSVIGMGKLGGDELNFNSDIDVVMAYSGQGQATGRRALDASEYFSKVARALIQRLDTVTVHGRVWAVDTRLRPFGSTSALAWSVPAMEAYFLNEGRTWERYAWLKASHASGDAITSQSLLDALKPFIYRRYLDYGIFDALRSLHEKIDGQSQRLGGDIDIKRGPGGIRALEFLVQSLQLLEGGRAPDLQVTGFLPALRALRHLDLLADEQAKDIESAYAFLRTVENRLQAMTGRQTHQLPTEHRDWECLTRLMGYSSVADFKGTLAHTRDWVQKTFQSQFLDKVKRPTAKLSWPPSPDLDKQLGQHGLDDDTQTVSDALLSLNDRLRKRPLSREGRLRLERFMPELVEKIIQQPDPTLGLSEMLLLIERIAQRSSYLALLYERPEITDQVIKTFRASEQVARWVIDSPQLLDDLIDPQHRLTMPTPPTMDPNDLEAGLNQLGRWRQTTFLKIALAELNRSINTEEASAHLTKVAETCLQVILESLAPDMPLAVIAYGNAGAGTLHYASDLDCVFLHSPSQDAQPLIKVAQRLISMLQLPLPGGRLFEIDTRLRPNGRAGLLVSDIDQFQDYQQSQAWLWEHQALIRARWVAGDVSLKKRFNEIRRDVLMQPRNPRDTAETLHAMRVKQQQERQESAIRKRLTDLQFVSELGVLTQAHARQALVEARSPSDQLPLLSGLDLETKEFLVGAWQMLRAAQHHQWLDRQPSADIPLNDTTLDQNIQAAWQALSD